jgi:hypothetical protein
MIFQFQALSFASAVEFESRPYRCMIAVEVPMRAAAVPAHPVVAAQVEFESKT